MAQTSTAKIENSALGSWAGYIYQGLCGVYHALSLLLTDEAKYVDYYLNLDSYEDFSILDGNKHIVSLHQCKDEKQVKQYVDEQQKMLAKKESLITAGLTDAHCQVYFHNAHNIKLKSKDIQLYKYHNNQSYCQSSDILKLISELIDKFPNIQGSKTCILQAVCFIVDSTVMRVQKIYFDSKKIPLKKIARTESEIAFRDLNKILKSPPFLSIDKDVIPSYVRTQYILKLNQIISDDIALGFGVNVENIDNFIKHITALDGKKLIRFLQRINPHVDFSSLDENLLLNVCSDEKISSLFNQLNELEPLSDQLDWETLKSKQTPTTLLASSLRENYRLCKRIYDLSPNLDCLWEYDWLVGNVIERVDSISQACNINSISQTEDDSKNIFSQKNVGILTISDKKNGTFE